MKHNNPLDRLPDIEKTPVIAINCTKDCFNEREFQLKDIVSVTILARQHQQNNYGHFTNVIQEKEI